MKIESCTTSKYRDLSQPGDDILVVVPQCLYAVFDGATDTAGVSVQGESPGRLGPGPAQCGPAPRLPWWKTPAINFTS